VRASFFCLAVALLIAIQPSPVHAVREQAVAVDTADGLKLAATVLRPNAPSGPVPAALLIQGSGPTDRDGNQVPHWTPSTLKRIAVALAASGVASLRFDKRGMGANASQRPTARNAWRDFFRWERFVADADAALQHLKQLPSVNSNAVFIVGHSEGGLIALELVSRLKRSVSGIVLLATPGRPPGALLSEQVSRILNAQGASATQITELVDAQAAIQRTIRETGKVPSSMPPGLAALYPPYLGLFLQSFLNLKPKASLRRVDVPTLAIFGRADMQVSANRDGAIFMRVARERSNGSRVIVLENSNHVLQAETSPIARDKPLHPDVMRAILTFIEATSNSRRPN